MSVKTLGIRCRSTSFQMMRKKTDMGMFACQTNYRRSLNSWGCMHFTGQLILLWCIKGDDDPSPTVPWSIFPNVLASCVPSHSSSIPRLTKKILSCVRDSDLDEMKVFREQGSLKSASFQAHFMDYFSHRGLLVFSEEGCVIFSKERTGCVHSFPMYFTM